MRIGFATIYSWRPHVEHTWYLAKLAQQKGHQTLFLACDGKLPTCYTREFRNNSKFIECTTCRLGGIRSFASFGVSNLSSFFDLSDSPKEVSRDWSYSSASTLKRFESPSDYLSSEFEEAVTRFNPVVRLAYNATLSWIATEKIDAVCIFNGRIDVTRAIFEAAKFCEVPIVTHERSWFGDGIQLFPGENCLSLKSVNKLVSAWVDKPLLKRQAVAAAQKVAKRFLKVNLTEWRAYNLDSIASAWPSNAGAYKVLILPSSSNEIWGHDDWQSGWGTITEAFETVLENLPMKSISPVMRCHPNWAEQIGSAGGARPENYYTEWAQKMKVHYIPSSSSIDTLNLIQQADLIIVTASSAAIDAGVLGKKVISVTPSAFQQAKFTINIHKKDELNLMESTLLNSSSWIHFPEEISRRTLRFIYTLSSRIPQYVNNVRARSSSEFSYFVGADPDRFLSLFTEGELRADDESFSDVGTGEEDKIIDLLAKRQWKTILSMAEHPIVNLAEEDVSRRFFFQWIDKVRALAPIGDR